jgi:hypothetical protein
MKEEEEEEEEKKKKKSTIKEWSPTPSNLGKRRVQQPEADLTPTRSPLLRPMHRNRSLLCSLSSNVALRTLATKTTTRGFSTFIPKMSKYVASVPDDGSVKPEILKFFESFYQISDTPDAHEKYAAQFTKNAKFVMASNEANGSEGMIQKPFYVHPAITSMSIVRRRHFPPSGFRYVLKKKSNS